MPLLAALALALVVFLVLRGGTRTAYIRPDEALLKPAMQVSELSGLWSVDGIEPASNVPLGDKALMHAASRGRLAVTGHRAVLTLVHMHSIDVVELSNGALKVRAPDGSLHSLNAKVGPNGTLVLDGNEGRFQGRAWLRH